MLDLLKEILKSDMAMREEDEGNVSPLLDKVRAAVKAEEGKTAKTSLLNNPSFIEAINNLGMMWVGSARHQEFINDVYNYLRPFMSEAPITPPKETLAYIIHLIQEFKRGNHDGGGTIAEIERVTFNAQRVAGVSVTSAPGVEIKALKP